jgi:translocator protein
MKATTLIATSLATATTAVVGSVASRSSVDGWYRRVRKPGYVPPNVVFPIAWTTLYTDIAATSASALDSLRAQGRHDEAQKYTAALATNLALNASWTWVFFKLHKLGPAAVLAGVLTASSADLARRTAAAQPTSGKVLIPYPLWCAFATVMSTDIWRLNRNRRALV